MSPDDLKRFGADMAIAVWARGQHLGDLSGNAESAAFLRQVYEDAAQVVELRTSLACIGLLSASTVKRERRG